MKFTLTADHVKLLRHAYVDWEGDREYGAPVIGQKRPYGSKHVAESVARIAGIDYDETSELPDCRRCLRRREREQATE